MDQRTATQSPKSTQEGSPDRMNRSTRTVLLAGSSPQQTLLEIEQCCDDRGADPVAAGSGAVSLGGGSGVEVGTGVSFSGGGGNRGRVICKIESVPERKSDTVKTLVPKLALGDNLLQSPMFGLGHDRTAFRSGSNTPREQAENAGNRTVVTLPVWSRPDTPRAGDRTAFRSGPNTPREQAENAGNRTAAWSRPTTPREVADNAGNRTPVFLGWRALDNSVRSQEAHRRSLGGSASPRTGLPLSPRVQEVWDACKQEAKAAAAVTRDTSTQPNRGDGSPLLTGSPLVTSVPGSGVDFEALQNKDQQIRSLSQQLRQAMAHVQVLSQASQVDSSVLQHPPFQKMQVSPAELSVPQQQLPPTAHERSQSPLRMRQPSQHGLAARPDATDHLNPPQKVEQLALGLHRQMPKQVQRHEEHQLQQQSPMLQREYSQLPAPATEPLQNLFLQRENFQLQQQQQVQQQQPRQLQQQQPPQNFMMQRENSRLQQQQQHQQRHRSSSPVMLQRMQGFPNSHLPQQHPHQQQLLQQQQQQHQVQQQQQQPHQLQQQLQQQQAPQNLMLQRESSQLQQPHQVQQQHQLQQQQQLQNLMLQRENSQLQHQHQVQQQQPHQVQKQHQLQQQQQLQNLMLQRENSQLQHQHQVQQQQPHQVQQQHQLQQQHQPQQQQPLQNLMLQRENSQLQQQHQLRQQQPLPEHRNIYAI
eukprot:TRINITY_DN17050_c0_g1_i1.p1 TRINITY_DN17050_c0_g1~~TRINITY_DN17050_c0_g1_i1.p1  ORF type:complete len:746 (-),score=165.68 TRINITY_DN17050_c0_g1_i1:109-2202(-)